MLNNEAHQVWLATAGTVTLTALSWVHLLSAVLTAVAALGACVFNWRRALEKKRNKIDQPD